MSKFIIALLALSTLTGCMSPMALKKYSTPLDVSDKSIAIFTLTTENRYKPNYKPNVKWIEIKSSSGSKKYKTEGAHKDNKNSYEYLISVDVDPGTHELSNVMGQSFYGLAMGSFLFPVDGTFWIPARSVTYIGHIDMVNRKRNEGERRSGSVLPLIDQAVSGYAGGTFDITVSDRNSTDIPQFVKKYPNLRGINIGTSMISLSK